MKFITTCIITFAAFAVVGFYSGRASCEKLAAGMGLRCDYSVLAGCRVEVAGKLVPIEMIRITDKGDVIVSGNGEG